MPDPKPPQQDLPSLNPDIDLEQKAQDLGREPMHPLVSKITHKFGLFNLVRNKVNQDTVDIEKAKESL